MPASSVQVVLSFVEKINQGNVSSLADLLSEDHTFIDASGDAFTGLKTMAKRWRDYLAACPEYQIFIRQIYQYNDQVILIGHTTGSHLNLPDVVEFHAEGVIWKAETSQGKVAAWQILQDTQEHFDQLKLDSFIKCFNPTLFAKTIARHLDLLPSTARTQDVRNVRKFYSRLYRDAKTEDIISLAKKLLLEEGYRFLPYELIHYHPGAIAALTAEDTITLGHGINDLSSADIYAQFIAGPAWKTGVISDDHVNQWIASENLWWRRAAVVSTIYLEGDIERMLHYTKQLLDDQEDLIIKALSWVLRSAIQHNQAAVVWFLDEYEGRLASRVKREVRNELETKLNAP